jgi:hypothetical protein
MDAMDIDDLLVFQEEDPRATVATNTIDLSYQQDLTLYDRSIFELTQSPAHAWRRLSDVQNSHVPEPGDRQVDEQRLAPGDRQVDEQRLAPGDRQVDEQRLAPGDRQVDEQRLSPGDRQVDEQRLSPGDCQVVEQRLAQGDRQVDEQRLAPRDRQVVEQRVAPGDRQVDDERRHPPGYCTVVEERRDPPGDCQVDEELRDSPEDCQVDEELRDSPEDRHIVEERRDPPGDCQVDEELRDPPEDCQVDEELREPPEDCQVDEELREPPEDCQVDEELRDSPEDCQVDEELRDPPEDCQVNQNDCMEVITVQFSAVELHPFSQSSAPDCGTPSYAPGNQHCTDDPGSSTMEAVIGRVATFVIFGSPLNKVDLARIEHSHLSTMPGVLGCEVPSVVGALTQAQDEEGVDISLLPDASAGRMYMSDMLMSPPASMSCRKYENWFRPSDLDDMSALAMDLCGACTLLLLAEHTQRFDIFSDSIRRMPLEVLLSKSSPLIPMEATAMKYGMAGARALRSLMSEECITFSVREVIQLILQKSASLRQVHRILLYMRVCTALKHVEFEMSLVR